MWIVRNMRWIMLVSGGLTATMVQAAITPDPALQSNFGETVSGPLAHLVVRNWGALIALVGGMLIYGAFNPPQRRDAAAGRFVSPQQARTCALRLLVGFTVILIAVPAGAQDLQSIQSSEVAEHVEWLPPAELRVMGRNPFNDIFGPTARCLTRGTGRLVLAISN